MLAGDDLKVEVTVQVKTMANLSSGEMKVINWY